MKNECVKPQEEVPRLEKRSHGEFVSAPELKDNPLAKPKGFGFVEYDDYFMILVSLIYPFHSENVKQLFVYNSSIYRLTMKKIWSAHSLEFSTDLSLSKLVTY